MKRLLRQGFFLLLSICFFLAGCSSKASTPFEEEDITLSQLEEMMDNKETFILLVERDSCPFCEALNLYIDRTKEQYGDVHLYKLNTTNYELYRENEGDLTLVSTSADGQAFLARFPYFLYTPVIYKIQRGQPIDEGVGFDSNLNTISNWNVDSPIDWNQAKPIELWTFLGASPYTPKEEANDSKDSKNSKDTSSKESSVKSSHSKESQQSQEDKKQEDKKEESTSSQEEEEEETPVEYVEDEDGWFSPIDADE